MKTTSSNDVAKFAFDTAPRCGARTKNNNGNPCRSPAVHGKKRCRLHGGAHGSGAPKGNQNAKTHGFHTQESKQLRKYMRELLKETDDFLFENSEEN